MVSVLADGPFFGGGWEDVRAAALALRPTGTGVLAKEFVLDLAQVDLAAASGADLVLVIVRIVPDDGLLRALVDRARDAGIEALVEIGSEDELDRAVGAGARIAGVNARDLDTLAVDVARAMDLARRVPAPCVSLHLSGLRTERDVRAIAASPCDGALIGEILMREDDPGALLRSFVRAAGGAPR
jgi:indole-3-glycerol phosphate synthase